MKQPFRFKIISLRSGQKAVVLLYMYCSVSVTCTRNCLVFFPQCSSSDERTRRKPCNPTSPPVCWNQFKIIQVCKLSWSSLLHNLPEKRGPSGEPIWRTKQRQSLFFFPLKFSWLTPVILGPQQLGSEPERWWSRSKVLAFWLEP